MVDGPSVIKVTSYVPRDIADTPTGLSFKWGYTKFNSWKLPNECLHTSHHLVFSLQVREHFRREELIPVLDH